jgi:anaerobic selenocysteine-containing dehydrogenase
MEKLDFLVVCDIFPTATTEIADLVLPMASYFESYGYRAYSSVEGGFLALARPFADPPGSARPVFEVEYDLAEKMGLHENYPFRDTQGWIDFMLEPCGASFQKLEKEQILYVTPPVQYEKYRENGFQTPSGKVELSSPAFESRGYGAVPSYSEPAGEPLVDEEMTEKGFPLMGSTRRPALFVHTKLKNIDALSRLYPEPLVWMHPEDVSERGIEEGEEVDVTSPQGKITIRARVTEDTQPGLVWIDFGWGNPTDEKANINVLTNDAFWDPISGGTPNRLFPCEIKKVS